MGIPIGTKYTSTVKGSVLKPVECGFCQSYFVYRMMRIRKGQGSSLLWLDNSGAQRRAQEAAHSKLVKSLDKGLDVVSCPSCGCYQRDMIRKLRWVRTAWILGIGVLILVMGPGLMYMVGRLFPHSAASVSQALTSGALQVFIVASLLWVWIRDPNNYAPSRIEKARSNPALLSEDEILELVTREVKPEQNVPVGSAPPL
jgi:hypothetical protein